MSYKKNLGEGGPESLWGREQGVSQWKLLLSGALENESEVSNGGNVLRTKE